MTDTQRRNLFSGLGSASSSSFIEQQTGADSEFNRNQAMTEAEMAGKIGTIDQQITGAQVSAQNAINKLIMERDTRLADIERSKLYSGKQKYVDLERANVDFRNKLDSIQSSVADQINQLNLTKLNLQTQKQQFQDTLAANKATASAGNGINSLYESMLKTQLEDANALKNWQINAPQGFILDLRNMKNAIKMSPDSATALATAVQSLKSKWGNSVTGLNAILNQELGGLATTG